MENDISVRIDMNKLRVGDILEDMTEDQQELLVDLVDGARRHKIEVDAIPFFIVNEVVRSGKEDLYLSMSPVKQAVLIQIMKRELLRLEG